MKTKVTMKVKHFVTILFGVFVILPLVGMFLFPQVELLMAKHAYDNLEAGAKEKVLAALDSRILPNQKYNLIANYVLGYEGYEQYDIYVGPMMSSSSYAGDSMVFSWDEKLEYVKDYLENGPVNYGLYSAAEKLAGYAVSQGDLEWAIQIYEHALERMDANKVDYNYYETSLSYAQLLFRERAYNQLEEHLLETLSEIPDLYADYSRDAIEYYFQTILRKGNQEQAIKDINALIEEHADQWRDPYENKGVEESYVYQRLVSLEKRLHNTENWSEGNLVTVSGHVTRADGTPLANVGVYLRDEKYSNMSLGHSEAHLLITTDDSGYFEMDRVSPGEYQMHAGFTIDHIAGYTWPVSMDDVISIDGSEDITYDITLAPLMDVYEPINETVITDDELTFAWEEVPGAAYYMLGFMIEGEGVSYGINLDKEFTDTEVTVPIELLYHHSPGILIDRDEMDEDFYDPAIYLGFSYPDGRFSWDVAAFDADGNILTQSDGYRLNQTVVGDLPVLYLKNRELILADKLLIDNKVDEALAAYKQNAEENPEDDHSLRMITRLIGIEGDGSVGSFDKLQLPYLEQLAIVTGYDLYYEQVLMIYEDLGDETAYEKWKALYEEAS